jgi:thioredoxin reductase (NADPH)
MPVRDVIIVGAGPSGLSAAIAAQQRRLDYQVLEQGVLVNSIYHFPPQMVFFTTPELLEIGGLPFVTPYDKPTRAEALKYYRRVVDTFDLQIAFEETVVSVEIESGGSGEADTAGGAGRAREAGGAGESGGSGGTRVFAVTTRSKRGVQRVREARNVIMAIGYYDHPVMIGVLGEDLPHVHHYYGEPHPHYRQRVVIVGGGNSAAESALEMFRAGAHV